jgi:hypothetical protein
MVPCGTGELHHENLPNLNHQTPAARFGFVGPFIATSLRKRQFDHLRMLKPVAGS